MSDKEWSANFITVLGGAPEQHVCVVCGASVSYAWRRSHWEWHGTINSKINAALAEGRPAL